MNPKARFGNIFRIAALSELEFHNKKTTKTIKNLVANLCALKCLNSTLSFASLFLNIRSWRDITAIADNSQALFLEIEIFAENSGALPVGDWVLQVAGFTADRT